MSTRTVNRNGPHRPADHSRCGIPRKTPVGCRRVVGVDPAAAREVIPGNFLPPQDSIEVIDEALGVFLECGSKVVLNARLQFDASCPKAGTDACSQCWRLAELGPTKDLLEECPGRWLLTARHGKLRMVPPVEHLVPPAVRRAQSRRLSPARRGDWAMATAPSVGAGRRERRHEHPATVRGPG